MMQEYLAEAGHRLDCAYNGRSGLAAALNGAYDLAILDVMLPVFDGLTLLQQLRRRKDLPVIMLTARARQQDRILGLDTGADDYLPKPFDPDELLARIRAVLRRADAANWKDGTVITIGEIQINARGVGGGLAGGADSGGVRPAGDADALGGTRCLARRDYGGSLRTRGNAVRSLSRCSHKSFAQEAGRRWQRDPRHQGSWLCIYRSGLSHCP